MKALVALAVGYAVGAKSRGAELDQLRRSMRALFGTDEFGEVVTATRAQVASSLREVASVIDGARGLPDGDGDLVARVRHLVGRD